LKLNTRISFSWYWVEQWRNNRKWHVHLCNNERIDEQLERAEYERIDELERAKHERVDDLWSDDGLVFKSLRADSSGFAFEWLMNRSDIEVSARSAWEVIEEAKDWIAWTLTNHVWRAEFKRSSSSERAESRESSG